MKVYVIQMFKNDGYGLRFDNFDYLVDTKVAVSCEEACGLAEFYAGPFKEIKNGIITFDNNTKKAVVTPFDI